MSKNAYTVADGYVLRGAEKVAAYDETTGALTFPEDKKSYRGAVVRWLRAEGKLAEVPPDAPETEPEGTRANRVAINPDIPAPVAEPSSEPDAPMAEPVDGIIIKKDGKPVIYRDRLTPQGWV